MDTKRNGLDCFSVSTPARLKMGSLHSLQSRRIFKLLHYFTPRVKAAASKTTGFYPRDLYIKKAVKGSEQTNKLHFHQHTIDIQGRVKVLRSDIGKSCAELLGWEAGVDYMLQGKKYMFTLDQAHKAIAELGPVQFGTQTYMPRLLLKKDFDEFMALCTIDVDGDYHEQSSRRKLLLRLLDLAPNQTYLLGDGAMSVRLFAEQKKDYYMGVFGGLTSSDKAGLLRICFEKVLSPRYDEDVSETK